MKKLLLLLTLSAFTLTGCMETFEEFTIGADGSGTYRASLDMSGMMEMLDMMAAMDESGKEAKKLTERDIDSTASMRAEVDASTELTEEQKRLFRDAKMNMKISQKQKTFKMSMDFPFKSLSDLETIISLNSQKKGVGLFGNPDKENPLSSLGEGGNPLDSDVFSISFKNGLIERKIDPAKLEKMKGNEKMEDMKGMEQMLDAIVYKTVFNLPRPATKVTGEKITLSSDKKSVTIKSTLGDMMNNAKALEFRIEY